MLTIRTENRLNAIVENYVNGNKFQAANQVRRLNRLELVQLLRNTHSLGGQAFLCRANDRYDFEAFVERAVSTPDGAPFID